MSRMLVVLATRGGDGGGVESIDLSMNHHMGGGGWGRLDIDLPIFSPASPFASQSKLKVVLTRLPFVTSMPS